MKSVVGRGFFAIFINLTQVDLELHVLSILMGIVRDCILKRL